MRSTIGEHAGRQRWLSCSVAFALSVGSVAVSQAGIGGTSLLAAMKGNGGADLEVLGVVEASSPSGLVVSGQTVHVVARGAEAALPAKGALVAVYGSLLADGTISASQVSQLNLAYVPGATTLYVRGVVKTVNASVGRAQVGSLSIDYTAALYDSSAQGIEPGAVVEFSGLQTLSALFASRVSPMGIGGTSHAVVSPMGIGGTSHAVVSPMGIGGTSHAVVSPMGIGGTSHAVVSPMGIGGTSHAVVSPMGIGGTSHAVVSPMGIGGTSHAVVSPMGIGGTSHAVVSPMGIGGTSHAVVSPMGIGGTSHAVVSPMGIGGTSHAVVSPMGIGGTSH